MQALTQRKVDFAFRVYQALLGGAAGGDEAQALDTDTQVGLKEAFKAYTILCHLLCRCCLWQFWSSARYIILLYSCSVCSLLCCLTLESLVALE